MPVVYAVKCLPTGFAYVGCTAGKLNKRMREHRCLLNAGEHKVTLLQQDWDRLGEEAFTIVALEQLPEPSNVVDKRVRELYWMQHFSVTGKLYNQYQVSFQPIPEAIEKGVAASAAIGHQKTPEARARQSEVCARTLQLPEVKAKKSKSLREKWRSTDPIDVEWQEKVKENLRRGREGT